jgi:D-alanyl-D-alanine carboxypeptidase (penicillin-binding protein 5/6)
MRYYLSLLTAVLTLCVLVPLRAGAEDAVSVLLTEANTGCVLYEENVDIPADPGSLAMLMTAYLTAQAVQRGELSADTLLTAGESVRGMRGAVVWLEPGDRMTVDELLLSLLAGNANDAAAVLADAVSGDAAQFVMDMNAAAFDLGMRDTRFTSPQGFEDPAAHTTARDMGLLACAVLRTPMLTPYVTTWRAFVKDGAAELVNENTLTRTLDGCRGLKFSHTGGRWSLIAAAEKNGMVCAAVVLNCADKDSCTDRARSLLREGFSAHKLAAPGYAEEFLVPQRIRGGTEQAVLLTLSKLPMLAVPKNAEITSVTVLPEFRCAPVRKGDAVGNVYFYSGKTLLAQSTLCAADDVPAMSAGAAWSKVRHFLFT